MRLQAVILACILFVVHLSVGCGVAFAGEASWTLTLRGGYIFVLGPVGQLVVSRSTGQYLALLASAALVRDTGPFGYVSIPEIRYTDWERSETLVPLAVGLRIDPLGRERREPQPFLELCPTLYWYRHADRGAGIDMNRGAFSFDKSFDRVVAGMQLGFFVPVRITSRLHWQFGLLYLFAPAVEQAGRAVLRRPERPGRHRGFLDLPVRR